MKEPDAHPGKTPTPREGLATPETLWELHRLVAAKLLEVLSGPNSELKASMIAVAKDFLRDNGVTLKNSPGTPFQNQEALLRLSFPFGDKERPN
jgi:hypothetical protein